MEYSAFSEALSQIENMAFGVLQFLEIVGLFAIFLGIAGYIFACKKKNKKKKNKRKQSAKIFILTGVLIYALSFIVAYLASYDPFSTVGTQFAISVPAALVFFIFTQFLLGGKSEKSEEKVKE